jgi:hypothetical protein
MSRGFGPSSGCRAAVELVDGPREGLGATGADDAGVVDVGVDSPDGRQVGLASF